MPVLDSLTITQLQLVALNSMHGAQFVCVPRDVRMRTMCYPEHVFKQPVLNSLVRMVDILLSSLVHLSNTLTKRFGTFSFGKFSFSLSLIHI